VVKTGSLTKNTHDAIDAATHANPLLVHSCLNFEARPAV